MRYPAAEKLEIIRLVEQSHLSVQQTLARIGVPRTTFYRWYDRYIEHGPEGLEDRPSRPSRVWNRIPDAVRDQIVELALEVSELSPRELAVRFTDTRKYFVSEASVYRLLKSYDLITSPAFRDKTTAPNQMWQTDFTYLKVIGWGWFDLSTVLDDFSRYIVGWKLCTNMGADDVSATLDIALAASGCDTVTVLHKPRLLSDNGPCYIAGDLAKYLEKNGMDHVRGAPNHLQTQGKIERWHQTLKNCILLENYDLEGELEAAIAAFVDYYNNHRYHESLGNLKVAADEHAALRKEGLRPGDPNWEKLGICDYITKPRIAAAITGKTPDGQDIDGDYKFTDDFPMAAGFEENAEFFTLTYESHVAVGANFAFQRVAPLLWMRAGSEGRRIDDLPAAGWDVADTYGLLVDLDRAAAFCDAAAAQPTLRIAYVVTDDDRRFQAVARALPDSVEPVRLYESYLSNFRFSMGR